jgi:hypothetical protein
MARFRIPLLWTAATLVVSGAVLDAIAGLAWPEHPPAWATRVTAVVFLLVTVTAGLSGLGFWRASRAREQGNA